MAKGKGKGRGQPRKLQIPILKVESSVGTRGKTKSSHKFVQTMDYMMLDMENTKHGDKESKDERQKPLGTEVMGTNSKDIEGVGSQILKRRQIQLGQVSLQEIGRLKMV
ncbi:hypothetical protein HAX54_019725 [Datura stramonium]|uniref:Uncharacterized protein n=1 Tax=Datura stramonium TaxID=4076 RepID=A0ABS8UPP6_DATST|nr:hypothetical protein [Datura stramonium]